MVTRKANCKGELICGRFFLLRIKRGDSHLWLDFTPHKREENVSRLEEVATINGKTIYRDSGGVLCTESNGFMFLRGLTTQEKEDLLQEVGFGPQQKAEGYVIREPWTGG